MGVASVVTCAISARIGGARRKRFFVACCGITQSMSAVKPGKKRLNLLLLNRWSRVRSSYASVILGASPARP